MLVVNEPELAEAINRLRGEWAERSGGELTATGNDLDGARGGEDARRRRRRFPSRYLGELCVRDWLRPVRANVLESEDFNADDFFPLVRNELIKWGGQVMALPLGVDPAAMHRRREQASGHCRCWLAAAPACRVERTARRAVRCRDDEAANRRAGIRRCARRNLTQIKPSDDEADGIAATDRICQCSVTTIGSIAVTASSRNAASAFKLIEWLASAGYQLAVRAAGERHDCQFGVRWHRPPRGTTRRVAASERAELSKTLDAALSGDAVSHCPAHPGHRRIPGRARRRRERRRGRQSAASRRRCKKRPSDGSRSRTPTAAMRSARRI